MLQTLTPEQSQWVDGTLAGLSLEAAVGQLLCISQFNDDRDYWLPCWNVSPLARRGRSGSAEDYRSFLAELQAASAVPLLVPANMEHGAAEQRGYGTDFPGPWASAPRTMKRWPPPWARPSPWRPATSVSTGYSTP
ncbi:MAG: hypothetical protein R2873_32750 [Caldilineaceae bacterium]